jgi:peptidoglycan/xylan/chitin deacetylase (PgdA/CDA1 family)
MKIIRKAGLVILLTIVGWSLNTHAAIRIQPEEKIKNIFTPILLYHRVVPKPASIYDITPDMLEKQIGFMLAQGYQPITALQYIKLQKHPKFFPDKPVVLTFDDGTKSHYQYVFPILQKYKIKATFFVYPGNIVSEGSLQLTWPELKKMAWAGMDIESHTFSHPFLTKTNFKRDDPRYLEWLDRELKESKRVLEEHLKTKVDLLAYSYGWFNDIVEAKTMEAGYQGAFTVNWGVNRTDENPLRLKRRAVSNQMSQVELERYLTSKPLSLNIISPSDAAVVDSDPVIRFKLENPRLMMIDMVVGNTKGVLRPNSEGVFGIDLKNVSSGYNTVIISGYDDQDQLWIGSWGFDYEPVTVSGTPQHKPLAKVKKRKKNWN